ncbi:conserved exported protein of unknown function [uncultured Sphingopyxis sp.]|uniref:DUF2059 domain-containing protein n=1 Tax=uncultured Sphingopyxis sp. TaxID=310581 RepID=A0A1Y5PNV6_9SPHN|nr:DUF2059 domain-containing protein [uncultured Sphingopyxis sp.]SBV31733.1 conserved exported protein of unknown function [uncultured Sphingopyxis sp.]
MTKQGRKYMMPSFQSILLAGAAALTPLAPAGAVQQETHAEIISYSVDQEDPASDPAEAKAKMQREMDEAIALIEKMFDTSDLPPIDPARLTLAQQTTAALIPAGSIEKMVDNLYGKMFKTFMGEFGGQSDLMLSIKTGVESDQIAALDEATKGKVADMFDPHRKERDEQINRVIKPLISEALADMEPPMREGLAKAYARKFTGAELTDLNDFLATPTGQLYAGEWMALQADPEVMVAVIKAVPPLITKFIDRAPAIEKDLKDLPKEKQLSDFDDKELGKLAKLLKVDVKTLEEHRDLWNSEATEAADAVAVDAADDYAVEAASEAADAAAVAADAAVAVDDPAYDRTNWSADDVKRVEELEAASAAAATAYLEAEAEAAEKARARLDNKPSD